jgi:hypothetical protein
MFTVDAREQMKYRAGEEEDGDGGSHQGNVFIKNSIVLVYYS